LSVRRWLAILVITFIIGAILHNPMLVALATSLGVVIILTDFWQRHSLDGVTYVRKFYYTRAFPGESIVVSLEVENRKLLPLSYLRTADSWPKAVGPQDPELLSPSHLVDHGILTHIFSLRWNGKVRRSYPLVFTRRGVYKVGPVTLTSGDLFGLHERILDLDECTNLTVFPALIPQDPLVLRAEGPFGDARARRPLFEDPNRPQGVREYHPEDTFRRVHWPATAHTGQLQVKVFQPTTSMVMELCLNVSTYARYWEGVYPQLLEHLVSLCATLATQGIQAGYRVGLISNGCLANSDQPFRVPPGRRPKQLAHLLTALAGVTPIAIGSFDNFLIRESPAIPYGATLVVITAIMSPGLAESILRLKRHERRITLVSLAREAPPLLPGVTILHAPFTLS